MKIAIIGGGMAGTACAYFLKQYDTDCILYETAENLAAQGSGNSLGLYNPRFAAEYTPESEFYKQAFELALEEFPKLGPDIDWRQFGALHLMATEKKSIRFNKMVASWPWGEDILRHVTAAQASEIAGVTIEHDALYLPQSGAVSPRALCRVYAEGTDMRLGQRVESLDAVEADIVILACGTGLNHLAESADLPLTSVRGQVSDVRALPVSAGLKTALCYNGYMMPADNGVHAMGSTFQRWLDHTDILPEDDQFNMGKLAEAVPALAGDYEIAGHRAGLRVASRDYFPLIGQLSERVYISAAHGSHGILSSLMGGKILAAMIAGGDAPVSNDVLQALSPRRFIKSL